ncbi:MAG TPA: 2-dehydro-3-deoxygalactonokinase [Puia sp.]|nr:2-dehydro-3-deoxygalactonokinase [Puia sp.]
MNGFISCDWGSTSLRLRWVDTDKQSVLAEIACIQGISTTFTLWKQGGRGEENRFPFYLSILKNQIDILEKKSGLSLKNKPLVISGMASSNIGMIELPYKELPFNVDGSDLYVKKIEASDEFMHEIILISGVKTASDVMRGEETQLAGCRKVNGKEEQIFIFPGTHSKHILIKENQAIDFKTYMTGEFISLLSKNSILTGNLVESDSNLEGEILENFEEGVANSIKHNLLHASFLARTNGLFNRNTNKGNYYWLSGLLIGTELKELFQNRKPVTLVCSEPLSNLYIVAFHKLGIEGIQFQDSVEATINGQCNIYKNHDPVT